MNATALTLREVGDAATTAAARALIGEYLTWVAAVAVERHGLVFDTAAMQDSDGRGATRFRLLCHGGTPVGVGGLKRLARGVAEVQRLYVQPPARGLGGGRLLLDRLLDDARASGIERVRLESLRSLKAAHALYRAAGFVEVAPWDGATPHDAYRHSVVFMELALHSQHLLQSEQSE